MEGVQHGIATGDPIHRGKDTATTIHRSKPTTSILLQSLRGLSLPLARRLQHPTLYIQLNYQSVMTILIIGASGRTGQLALSTALSRKHHVVALVRNPSSIASQPNLTLSQGTPVSLPDIERAITSAPSTDRITSIIVTLNAPRASDSPFAKPIAPPTLMADSNGNLLKAMGSHPEIKKIVTMSAWGVTDSSAELPWVMRLALRKTNMAVQFRDHDEVDKMLKESGAAFVLVRPVILSDKEEAKEVKVHGDVGKGLGFGSKISRASVAKFLLDAVERDDWNGKTPVISE